MSITKAMGCCGRSSVSRNFSIGVRCKGRMRSCEAVAIEEHPLASTLGTHLLRPLYSCGPGVQPNGAENPNSKTDPRVGNPERIALGERQELVYQ